MSHILTTLECGQRIKSSMPQRTRGFALILVYDSQYIKDMCTKPAHAPPPQKNRTVITLVKQLLNDAKDMGIKIHWIKGMGSTLVFLFY